MAEDLLNPTPSPGPQQAHIVVFIRNDSNLIHPIWVWLIEESWDSIESGMNRVEKEFDGRYVVGWQFDNPVAILRFRFGESAK